MTPAYRAKKDYARRLEKRAEEREIQAASTQQVQQPQQHQSSPHGNPFPQSDVKMGDQPPTAPPVVRPSATGANTINAASEFMPKTEQPLPVEKSLAVNPTSKADTEKREPQPTSIFANFTSSSTASAKQPLFKPTASPLFKQTASSVFNPNASSMPTSTGSSLFPPTDDQKSTKNPSLFVPSTDPVKIEWASYYWDKGIVSHIVASSTEIVELRSMSSKDKNSVVAVHKGLLTHFSPYYCGFLEGESEKHNTEYLTLRASEETLSHLVSWLYTGSIPPEGSRKRKRDDDSEKVSSRLHRIYLELYVLGHNHRILALQRWSLDQLRQLVTTRTTFGGGIEFKDFTRDEICFAFDSLPDTSPMREWMTTCYTYHYKPNTDGKLSDWTKVNPDFLAGVMLGQATRIMLCVGNIGKSCTCCQAFGNECAYHEHESEKERLATCNNYAPLRSELEALFFKEWK